MNYTKGEWEVKDSSSGGLVMAGLFPYVVGCAEGTIAKITILANAHLIAAAPDMYEALEAGKSVLLDIQQRESKTSFHGQRVASDCGEALKVIDKALAKAEGREQ